jgi:uncharacterized protein (TIGR00369 family)
MKYIQAGNPGLISLRHIMKRINNPYKDLDDGSYRCFGCSPANHIGLKLEFWDKGEEIFAQWLPEKRFEGFNDILHGGIQATLMDEAASWYIFSKCGTAGVTSEMSVKYLRPLSISKGEITISARLDKQEKRFLTIACKITDKAGGEYATGEVRYYIFPEEVAKSRFNYPGKEAFLA